MAFIKLIATDGRKAIINTDNVTALYNRGSETHIYFLDPTDCIVIPMNIEELTEKLNKTSIDFTIEELGNQICK